MASALERAARRVVALWSPPRCRSTVFERTFKQRSDTTIVHEPFTEVYYFSHERRSDRYGNQAALRDHDRAYAKRELLERPGPLVFQKELAFQALPYVDRDLLAELTNTFIVRRPDAVIASLYGLKPDFSEEELGFLAFERLFDIVTGELGQPPVVVEADRFSAEPERVLRAYCERIGVAFEAGMLAWDDGRIREWGPDQAQSQAKWHRTLEASRGVIKCAGREYVVKPEHQPALERAHRIYARIAAYAI